MAEKWPVQACQQFRLELSIAIDVMLGLKSAEKIEKIKSAGVICPELFDLVISTRMQKTVKHTFATIGTEEKQTSSAPLDYQADSEETSRKEDSSQNNKSSTPSSTTEEPKEKASPSISKQVTYARTRAISFYKAPKANSSQITTSQPTSRSELTRKRSLSALPKKASNSPASSAVPTLSPKVLQNENTFWTFGNRA